MVEAIAAAVSGSIASGDSYRRLRAVAICGAIAASGGDLMLLYMGNAQRPELGLAPGPMWVLWLGALLGVVGIPLYGLGYVGLRRVFAPRAPTLANVFGASGVVACVLGAVVHALTTRAIVESLAVRAGAQAPLEAVAGSGGALGTSWAACGVAFLVASGAFAALQWRIGSADARRLAAVNPIVVTIAIVLASMPSQWLRSFAAPASANLSHVAFFLFWSAARLARSTRVE